MTRGRIENALYGRTDWIVGILCVVAVAKVIFYAAVFPVFNNVDEQAHFDLVLKVARGEWPPPAEAHFDREAAELIVLYGSPEFLHAPESRRFYPPPWRFDRQEIAAKLEYSVQAWMRLENHEVHAPPAYYVVAAGWLKLGRVIGMNGGEVAFWIRFLNAPCIALFVWLAYRYCTVLYPERIDLHLGVPLLVATLPQDAYYAINSDLISGVLATAMLLGIAHLAARPLVDSSPLVWMGTGLGASAAVLAKLSNLPLLVVLGCAVFFFLWRDRRDRGDQAEIPRNAIAVRFGVLLLASLLPLAAWVASNLATLDDPLGVTAKVAVLGWTTQGIGEIVRHPIFTLDGMGFFLGGLIETLFRGEFVWALERIASPGMDALYLASSALLVPVALIASLRVGLRRGQHPRKTGSHDSKKGESPSAAACWPSVLLNGLVILGYFGFFAVLSVRYDFGDCVYPSSEEPFFVSGRLMLGALVPFFLFYVGGISVMLDRLLKRHGGRDWTLVVVAILAVSGLVVEATLTTPVFASAFNWFQLE